MKPISTILALLLSSLLLVPLASGAGLEAVLKRAASGTGSVPRWLSGVLDASAGKPMFSEGGKGTLRAAAEEPHRTHQRGIAVRHKLGENYQRKTRGYSALRRW